MLVLPKKGRLDTSSNVGGLAMIIHSWSAFTTLSFGWLALLVVWSSIISCAALTCGDNPDSTCQNTSIQTTTGTVCNSSKAFSTDVCDNTTFISSSDIFCWVTTPPTSDWPDATVESPDQALTDPNWRSSNQVCANASFVNSAGITCQDQACQNQTAQSILYNGDVYRYDMCARRGYVWACPHASFQATQDVYCQGRRSCHNARVQKSSNVTCHGLNACTGAEFVDSSAITCKGENQWYDACTQTRALRSDQIECQENACSNMHMMQSEVTCSGRACLDATVVFSALTCQPSIHHENIFSRQNNIHTEGCLFVSVWGNCSCCDGPTCPLAGENKTNLGDDAKLLLPRCTNEMCDASYLGRSCRQWGLPACRSDDVVYTTIFNNSSSIFNNSTTPSMPLQTLLPPEEVNTTAGMIPEYSPLFFNCEQEECVNTTASDASIFCNGPGACDGSTFNRSYILALSGSSFGVTVSHSRVECINQGCFANQFFQSRVLCDHAGCDAPARKWTTFTQSLVTCLISCYRVHFIASAVTCGPDSSCGLDFEEYARYDECSCCQNEGGCPPKVPMCNDAFCETVVGGKTCTEHGNPFCLGGLDDPALPLRLRNLTETIGPMEGTTIPPQPQHASESIEADPASSDPASSYPDISDDSDATESRCSATFPGLVVVVATLSAATAYC